MSKPSDAVTPDGKGEETADGAGPAEQINNKAEPQAMLLSKFKEEAPKDTNAFVAAIYWSDILNNHTKDAIGCSIPEFKTKSEECISRLRECAQHLDKINRVAKIATGFGILGKVAGAGMVIAGLALIPLTFGGSVGLSVAGGGVIAAGLTTTVAAAQLVKLGWRQSDTEEAKRAQEELVDMLSELNDLLSTCLNAFTNAYALLLKEAGNEKLKVAVRLSGEHSNSAVEEIASEISKLILKVAVSAAAEEAARQTKEAYIIKSLQKVKKDVWGALTNNKDDEKKDNAKNNDDEKKDNAKNNAELSSDMKTIAMILEDLSKMLVNMHNDFTVPKT